jgi:hypothetical protein
VPGARGDAFDAEFRAERLAVALDHLRSKHEAAAARARDAERDAEVARVTAERDELAEDLKARYPALVAELADLLTRIRASNVDCGRFGLTDVETTARGPMASDSPSLIRGCRLVNFSLQERFPIWPPSDHQASVVQLRQMGEAVSAARRAAAAAAG